MYLISKLAFKNFEHFASYVLIQPHMYYVLEEFFLDKKYSYMFQVEI